jgi:hypothetical protein
MAPKHSSLVLVRDATNYEFMAKNAATAAARSYWQKQAAQEKARATADRRAATPANDATS